MKRPRYVLERGEQTAIAAKCQCSQSHVARVVSGERRSPKIEKEIVRRHPNQKNR